MASHLARELQLYANHINAFEVLQNIGIDKLEEQEALKARVLIQTQQLVDLFRVPVTDRAEALKFNAMNSEFRTLVSRFRAASVVAFDSHIENANDILRSPSATAMFQKRSSLKIESKEQLHVLIEQEREQILSDIDKNLQVIKGIAESFAEHVENQGGELAQANKEVDRTDLQAKQAVEDLQQAKVYQDKARSRCLWAICLFAGGVVVGSGVTALLFSLTL